MKLADLGHASMSVPLMDHVYRNNGEKGYLARLYQETTSTDKDTYEYEKVELSKSRPNSLKLFYSLIDRWYVKLASSQKLLNYVPLIGRSILGSTQWVTSTLLRSDRLYRPAFDLATFMQSLLGNPSTAKLRVLRTYWCVEKNEHLRVFQNLVRFDNFYRNYNTMFMEKWHTFGVPLDADAPLTRPEDLLQHPSIKQTYCFSGSR